MTKSKFNIFKEITLGLSTIICIFALYSNANADQEIIDNDGIIILQEEESIDAVSVNSNIDNIPNYNVENNTDEVKESGIKKLFNKSVANNKGVLALVGVVTFGLVLVGIRFHKDYSKYQENTIAPMSICRANTAPSNIAIFQSVNKRRGSVS